MDAIKVAQIVETVAFSLGLLGYSLVMLLFQGCASWLGNAAARFISFERIDPDQAFAAAFIHHVVQMLIVLFAIIN